MLSDERLKKKQCKGEEGGRREGGKEGEENEELLPVTAFPEEGSLLLDVFDVCNSDLP